MNIEKGLRVYRKSLISFYVGKYTYPVKALLQKRNFHAFCLGTPKSGTHSIAGMLERYRASHEPNEVFMINLINRKIKREMSDERLIKILAARDRSNWLEIESSHYLGAVVEQLSKISVHAKYILTIRDCLSWMDSWFNHQLSRAVLSNTSVYDLGRNNYYSRGHEYTKYDRALESMKLFPIRSYLEFWNAHNLNVINSVAPDKLLIIRTHEISNSSALLSDFLNISESQIVTGSSHEFKARKQFGILESIDVNYLHDTAMEVCGELNDKYFPEKKVSQLLYR